MSTLAVDSIENLAGDNRFGPVAMTAQASTSGTSVGFTSIPSWVKKITVGWSNLSLSGTDHVLIRLGVSGTAVTSGYLSNSCSGAGTDYTSTAGFIVGTGAAASVIHGTYALYKIDSDKWVGSGVWNYNSVDIVDGAGGIESIGTVDSVFVVPTGSDTFDNGTINVIYE